MKQNFNIRLYSFMNSKVIKKIVYLMDCYISHDSAGATVAVRNLYAALKDSYEITIVCGQLVGVNNKEIPVKIISPQDVCQFLIDNSIDLIHYFKSTGRRYFSEIIAHLKINNKKLPIITTVCQKPSYFGLELSPTEIENSNMIVFIDKAAYSDKLYKFIDVAHKQCIYFGYTREHLDVIDEFYDKNTKNQETDNVIFGRGSSLNKCHKCFIRTFDRIDVENKRFIFIGGKSLPAWMEKEVASHANIKWIPSLPYKKWLEECSAFDVFLYQLPPDAYSSIDGTLGDAMLLGIPPIVYGPEAIKERINHGENGYIANEPDDIIHYANILASDVKLRKAMGENARRSTLKDFPLSKTVEKYKSLYDSIEKNKTTIKIPYPFYIFYCFRKIALIPRYIKSRFHE